MSTTTPSPSETVPATPEHPPIAARRPVERTFHGETVVDDYEWLRDKSDPEVLAHLEAENVWTERVTAHLAGLAEEVYSDIAARTQQTDLSVPGHVTHEVDGQQQGWWYYSRTSQGKDYPVFCRVPDLDGRRPDLSGEVAGEQVLLDANAEAEGTDFFQLGALDVARDGRLLAWAVDNAGDERYTLFVRDLATGQDFGPVVQEIGAGVAWAGTTHLFYTRLDDSWRTHQVWRHEIGSDPAGDVLVLQEDDEMFRVGVEESRDRRHLVFGSGSTLTTECWLLDADNPTAELRPVAGRTQGVEYSVEVADDHLLVLHNRNTPDFELAVAPMEAPSQWTTLVAGVEGQRLEQVQAYAGHAVLGARREGLSAVGVLARGDEGYSAVQWVGFDEPVHEVWAQGESDWRAAGVRLQYTSLVTPRSVLELDLDTLDTTLLKQTPVLDHPVHGAYDPSDYVQERLWATAPDGTQVPISLVHHKDVRPDGTAACLLYGYGSYEISMAPSFSISRLSLLQHGVVYAIAHVRGGGEMGRAWYDQGKMLAKRNTFTDFIACGEHLVATGWAAPDRLAARGGSAGGLLMGAVVNMAPTLFRAVHAAVPFVDALTTILKPELPLTAGEWEEWGNPITDAEVYHYMRGYTPYENVVDGPHPAILATTSLNDTRVFFTEPAKWVARLREVVAPDPERPVLLKTEMVAGHGGVSGRYGSWREEAFELAWILDQLLPGLTHRPAADPSSAASL